MTAKDRKTGTQLSCVPVFWPGGAAPLVVGGVATGYSEAFTAGVEADASRMASEVARKVKQYYLDRGWITQ